MSKNELEVPCDGGWGQRWGSMEAGLDSVPDFAVTSDDCIQTGSDRNMLLSQFL